jgi:hypothetical protein
MKKCTEIGCERNFGYIGPHTHAMVNELIERQRQWCIQARLDIANLLAIVLAVQTMPISEDDAKTVNEIEMRYRAGINKLGTEE